MPGDRKPDEAEILSYLRELSGASWLGAGRAQWPRHIYHFSDVRNIAAILQAGEICSRRLLHTRAVDRVDIANHEIIDQSPWTHDYARLYFRPRTPTQFQMEGIKRRSEDGAPATPHCPVPVFLLFNAGRMLTRSNAEFTDGNFARRRCSRGGDAAFLRALPFRTIYHDEAIRADDDKGEIVRARCAEVLYPECVDLDDLVAVVCRTPAERTTLGALLGPAASAKWRSRVRVTVTGDRLFFAQRPFIKEVRLVDTAVHVYADAFSITGYDFEAVIENTSGESMECRGELGREHGASFSLLLGKLANTGPLSVTISLAGCLAYKGTLSTQTVF
jgi:hypothetical protein